MTARIACTGWPGAWTSYQASATLDVMTKSMSRPHATAQRMRPSLCGAPPLLNAERVATAL